MASGANTWLASCRCGEVTLETWGAPILTAICACKSCQLAGARLEALPGAPKVLDAEGGTAFVLQRKDRARLPGDTSLLRGHRLTSTSPTRRVLASCCNSPMFLEFAGGHWLSIYRDRLGTDAPPVEMRVMAGDRPEGVTFDDSLPSYRSHSGRFMWRLLAAWAAMGFRAPKLQPIAAA